MDYMDYIETLNNLLEHSYGHSFRRHEGSIQYWKNLCVYDIIKQMIYNGGSNMSVGSVHPITSFIVLLTGKKIRESCAIYQCNKVLS